MTLHDVYKNANPCYHSQFVEPKLQFVVVVDMSVGGVADLTAVLVCITAHT